VPFDELALFPQQAVELGGIVWAEPAPQNELLRRRDRRDRIDLEEAEVPDRVEDRTCRPVE
jgi:hypothetical protein